MRPRVFPAEDDGGVEALLPFLLASMRPRVFPAEDFRTGVVTGAPALASMRPRVFPAEDVISSTRRMAAGMLQ